jgi:glycogen operon protein
MALKNKITAGRPTPLGTTVTREGINFAIFSRHATRVWLLLFRKPTDDQPSRIIELVHRTGDIWHIHVSGLEHGQLYLYQVDGPYEPRQGHRFNCNRPLLDPYARAITGEGRYDLREAVGYNRRSPRKDLSFSQQAPDLANMPKSIAYGDDDFDWQGDRPLNRPLSETIIYETHVRSLTCHPTAKVKYPGTYRGVIEQIPYFLDLGVTAIELLPIHQFNEYEFDRRNPLTGERLINYWGYNTLGFFAPHNAYSHLSTKRGEQVVAFKEMVRELHRAGLELILDVVFNHTVENNHLGPTLHFRGLDNSIYYILEEDLRFYKNFSGVGNTVNCNHPVVQDFIIDCLRYWVQEMHVDGFRFDLAVIHCRDEQGNIPAEPPLTRRIAEDPVLRHTKIIAEPWDMGGYLVGNFPGGRWAEWNDKFRDQVREFWRSDPGKISNLSTRFAGSADLYYHDGRCPNHSINFIAAHDGFTLNDLVSYNEKHNLANGEDNQDGHNHNISYNYGVEGPTPDQETEKLRNRQVKNFLATLLLSQGTPMINGGDEFRRTQQGNNNAYCQHNEISWYNWDFLKQHADIYRFAKQLIALRKAHPVFRRTSFLTGRDVDKDNFRDIQWYNPNGQEATWSPEGRCLMLTMDGSAKETGAEQDDVDVLGMINASDKFEIFYLPAAPHQQLWWLVIDTSRPSPHDIFIDHDHSIAIPAQTIYRVKPRSIVIMFSMWKKK